MILKSYSLGLNTTLDVLKDETRFDDESEDFGYCLHGYDADGEYWESDDQFGYPNDQFAEWAGITRHVENILTEKDVIKWHEGVLTRKVRRILRIHKVAALWIWEWNKYKNMATFDVDFR